MAWTRLADLARDIAGDLPPDLVAAWEDPAARTPDLARALLEPLAVRGTVVCSDTAGLSRMASVLPLAVVLKRIAEPRERIHALGTGLGGRAIGTWVADNSEMFYPPEVPLEPLLAGMVRIHGSGPVQIGWCAHVGTFYEVGGGLYGPDADRVETIAEVHTSGGDSLVTPEARAALDPTGFVFRERQAGAFGSVLEVHTDLPGPAHTGSSRFPIPYDPAMQALLHALDEADPTPVLEAIETRHRAVRTVLLAQRGAHVPARSLADTVDGLFRDASFQRIAKAVLAAHTPSWNVSGGLALAAFEDASVGLDAARALRSATRDAGLTVSIGIDRGDTYVFPMPGGRTELAGDPVNRASKLAEDLGHPGDLLVAGRVVPDGIPGAERVRYAISGIGLEGWRLPD
ncbi:MAG: hypothetical protein H6734_13515 [Alphaproteobacteria bacterium]|nr:hypothetical protein [Alphaproteobacteria bacterium]